MNRMKFLAAAIAAIVAISASAVPARRFERTVVQPDGSTVALRLVGDERSHFYLTDDNQMVLQRGDAYYFATIGSEGFAVPSEILASDSGKRSAEARTFLDAVDFEALGNAMDVRPSRLTRRELRTGDLNLADYSAQATSSQGVGLFPGTKFPNTGSPKGLVILVQYKDVKFTLADPKSYFTNMLTQSGFSQYNGTGSALDYFTASSNGQFTPDFKVYGPVTLSQNRSYYGGNDYYGNDKNPEQMVVEGCQLLDSQIDFSQFDEDGDGYVDNVFVFYAGIGEASSNSASAANSVWPHQFSLIEAGLSALTLDGTKINRYACSNEWEDYGGQRPDGIGTFVHEFSHVMGLPDLYNTSSSSNVYYTPSEWSVLDYGPYSNDARTPPGYSAFERNAMGWCDLTVLDGEPESITLENILDSNKACIVPTSKSTEFFLIENRQQKGWDTYLPGHGMLVWHVDYNNSVWNSNSVNNTRSHQYVDIEEACGSADSSDWYTLAGYPFPGNTNARSFTDTTSPSMKTWSGVKLGRPITNIVEKSGVITFDVCGGKIVVDTPEPIAPEDFTREYFVAQWSEVPEAVDYLLTVKTVNQQVMETDVNNFGNNSNTLTNASGWTTSTTETYTSAGNFGQSKPAFGMKKNNVYVMTPYYSLPITAVSFWAKGMNQTDQKLEIYGVDDTAETLLATLTDWDSSKGATYEVNITAPDVHQLKLKYVKSGTGNLALDDITVFYGAVTSTVLPDYNGVSTGGATSMKVDKLIDGILNYKYTVRAVDAAGNKSRESQTVDVDLNKYDGVAAAEAAVRVRTAPGLILIEGGVADIADISGRTVARGAASAEVAPGIYIVALQGRTLKVVVR